MKLIYTLLFFTSFYLVQAQEGLNRTWYLTELIVDGESITIPSEEFPTLSLSVGGSVNEHFGTCGCNDFFGMISATATEMTILDFAETLAVCHPSSGVSVEGAYFNFFGESQPQDLSYSIIFEDSVDFTELTLTKDNGDQAIFGAINQHPPEDLTEESWYLDYFEIDGIAQNYPPEQDGQSNPFTISNFGTDTSINQGYLCFSGGEGAYSAFDYFGTPTISISFLSLLAMDCGEPILNSYDEMFTQQLQGKTHTYEIIEEGQGRRLILTDQNGDRIFYTNAFLNTNEFTQDISIQLFPNPSQDKITISGERLESIQSYQIIDINGKVVMQNNFSTTIEIENLSTGMYFLKLRSDQLETTRRFIKE